MKVAIIITKVILGIFFLSILAVVGIIFVIPASLIMSKEKEGMI